MEGGRKGREMMVVGGVAVEATNLRQVVLGRKGRYEWVCGLVSNASSKPASWKLQAASLDIDLFRRMNG